MSIYAAYRRQRNSATYLFAEHGHSERSEESQHVEIVIHWPINTCERGNHTTGLRPWKTSKPPCGRWKCTPFGTFGTTFSPEGELLAVQCIEVLMRPEAERKANFPLRGKWCAAPKGVHFLRAKPGCTVFHSAERNYKTHRPKGDTFPTEPSEPSEPFLPPQPFYTTHGEAVPLPRPWEYRQTPIVTLLP